MDARIVELTKQNKSSLTREILYRGSAVKIPRCSCSGLVPAIARNTCGRVGVHIDFSGDIIEYIKVAVRIGYPSICSKIHSDWEWLVLAQHYKLTTRFLDWSKDPLVALYFATHNKDGSVKSEKDGDSVLWICKVPEDWYVNEKPTADDEKLAIDKNKEASPFNRCFYAKLRTMFYDATHMGLTRIQNQASVMCRQVYYPSDQTRGECGMVPLDENKDFKDRITKIPIRAEDYVEINDVLAARGMTKDTILPKEECGKCLEGIFKKLNEKTE